MSAPGIADRTGIHKSCKSLEVVVNVLNDYCEAANALVAIQKKLAKAVREAASAKSINDIASNALTSSAAVLEAVSEVDSKFAKVTDKECDGISAEVRKWFKRLAKEERTHDEKLSAANARIKQAGQLYEKKVKKNPADAVEEHTRYMNLLSSLGPEISQEKHNHASFVSQRHSAILYSTAACLTRIADAEWLAACEYVRRISPTIGQVGEWRALCEGGWSGAVPNDLPDVDAEANPMESSTAIPDKTSRVQAEADGANLSSSTTLAANTSNVTTPAGPSPQMTANLSPAEGWATEVLTTADPESIRDRSLSVNSLASLGFFPAPPTHFPLPPITNHTEGDTSAQTPKDERSIQSPLQSSSPAVNARTEPSTSSVYEKLKATEFLSDSHSPVASPSTPVTSDKLRLHSVDEETAPTSPPPRQSTPNSSRSTDALSTQPSVTDSGQISTDRRGSPVLERSSQGLKKGDYVEESEFGVRKAMEHRQQSVQDMQAVQSNAIERSDTGRSNKSVVAAMRDRYARTTGPSSPPPRDVPRLPLSVSNLANRYDAPSDASLPATRRLPNEERSQLSPDSRHSISSPPLERSAISSSQSSSSYSPAASLPSTEDILRRRRRIQELEELELKEQEHELRMKEKEIELRAKELERDRLRLQTVRGTYASDASPRLTGPRPPLHDSLSSPTLQSRHPYAASSTHFSPSMSQRYPGTVSSAGQSPSPSPLSSPPIDHPSYCACEACTVMKYRTGGVPPTPRDLRPPEPPITLRPEKPKGWIRRLSMPVMGNAFASDSKKGISNTSIVSYRNSLALPEEDGRLRMDYTSGNKNRSMTNLGGR